MSTAMFWPWLTQFSGVAVVFDKGQIDPLIAFIF